MDEMPSPVRASGAIKSRDCTNLTQRKISLKPNKSIRTRNATNPRNRQDARNFMTSTDNSFLSTATQPYGPYRSSYSSRTRTCPIQFHTVSDQHGPSTLGGIQDVMRIKQAPQQRGLVVKFHFIKDQRFSAQDYSRINEETDLSVADDSIGDHYSALLMQNKRVDPSGLEVSKANIGKARALDQKRQNRTVLLQSEQAPKTGWAEQAAAPRRSGASMSGGKLRVQVPARVESQARSPIETAKLSTDGNRLSGVAVG